MKEELLGIERYQGPKERSLAQASSNLEAMQTTREGLDAELHQVSANFTKEFTTDCGERCLRMMWKKIFLNTGIAVSTLCGRSTRNG